MYKIIYIKSGYGGRQEKEVSLLTSGAQRGAVGVCRSPSFCNLVLEYKWCGMWSGPLSPTLKRDNILQVAPNVGLLGFAASPVSAA